MAGRREGWIFEGWMGRSELCLKAMPALGGPEVTLSLSLPSCLCSFLPHSPLCLSGISAPHAGTGSWFL